MLRIGRIITIGTGRGGIGKGEVKRSILIILLWGRGDWFRLDVGGLLLLLEAGVVHEMCRLLLTLLIPWHILVILVDQEGKGVL